MEIELDAAARAAAALMAAADLMAVAASQFDDHEALYCMAAVWLEEEHERLAEAMGGGVGPR